MADKIHIPGRRQAQAAMSDTRVGHELRIRIPPHSAADRASVLYIRSASWPVFPGPLPGQVVELSGMRLWKLPVRRPRARVGTTRRRTNGCGRLRPAPGWRRLGPRLTSIAERTASEASASSILARSLESCGTCKPAWPDGVCAADTFRGCAVPRSASGLALPASCGPYLHSAPEPCDHGEQESQHSGQQERNPERQVPVGTEAADVHTLAVFQEKTSRSSMTTANSTRATHSPLIRRTFYRLPHAAYRMLRRRLYRSGGFGWTLSGVLAMGRWARVPPAT